MERHSNGLLFARYETGFKCICCSGFRGAFCDADQYLMLAIVRERLVLSKRTHKVETEMFRLKQQNDVEGKEQHQIETSYISQV
jgi:hypothetical protein